MRIIYMLEMSTGLYEDKQQENIAAFGQESTANAERNRLNLSLSRADRINGDRYYVTQLQLSDE